MFQRIKTCIAAAVCVLCSLAAAPDEPTPPQPGDFEAWDSALPADYGLTTRDWCRAAAWEARRVLEAGQPVAERTRVLYGMPFPGLKWIGNDTGGRMALDESTTPENTHVMPRGFGNSLAGLLGPLINDPHYDPSILGVDKNELEAMARALIGLHVRQPHRDFDFGATVYGETPLKKYSCRPGAGPGLFWFVETHMILHFLGNLMTDAQRRYYLDPVESGRQGHQMQPWPHERVHVGGWSGAGNSLIEENTMGLDPRIFHCAWLKSIQEPGWEDAMEELNFDFLNAWSTLHLRHCTELVEGKPVNQWARGDNLFPDFTCVNHCWPDVAYGKTMLRTGAWASGWFLANNGSIPQTLSCNLDWVLRRFYLPLTLWQGRVFQFNVKELNRYGELAEPYFASAMPTYLKLAHRDGRAARLERDILAFTEWSGLVFASSDSIDAKRLFASRDHVANMAAGVEVQPSSEESLQQWLSCNALFWSDGKAHPQKPPGAPGIAVNRTPLRFALMGGDGCAIDWAVIPGHGDWIFSSWGRMGKAGGFVERRTDFFGGGFAGVGRKTGLTAYALVALPDEQTTVIFCGNGLPSLGGSTGGGEDAVVSLQVLSTPLNLHASRFFGPDGCVERHKDADRQPGRTPGMLRGNWMNIENRIGYVIVRPDSRTGFTHGPHAAGSAGEFRIPVSWPNADLPASCSVIVCGQTAEATRAMADEKRCRWLENDEFPGLSAALVPGQDGADYLVVFNAGAEPADLSAGMDAGNLAYAPILGEWFGNAKNLSLEMPPLSVGLAQLARAGAPAPPRPQVRLIEPALTDVFAGAQKDDTAPGCVALKAEASGLAGVKEVCFYVRQGSIFAEPRLLGAAAEPPYAFTWQPEKGDRGRYAELWATAVAPCGAARESSHALVMVVPEDAPRQ